jgi:hypothetical protein
LQNLHRSQKSTDTWEQIWSADVRHLEAWVKKRGKAVDKANYTEKANGAFNPIKILANFARLEGTLWHSGDGNVRSAVTWLRNRMILLATEKGILRGESIMKAELSDFLGVPIKQANDPHMSYICIMEIAFGKYIIVDVVSKAF